MANFPESARSPEGSQGDSTQNNYPQDMPSVEMDDFGNPSDVQGRQWVDSNEPGVLASGASQQGNSPLLTAPQSGSVPPGGSQTYESPSSGGGGMPPQETPLDTEESNKDRGGYGDKLLWGVVALLVVLFLALAVFVFADRIYTSTPPEGPEVTSPANGLTTEIGVPVAVQSFHPENVSRVELLVKHETELTPTLKRADVPDENGQLLQLWTPLLMGTYTIEVKPVDFDNNPVNVANAEGITRTIVVVDSPAVRLPIPGEKTPTATPELQQVQVVANPQAQGYQPPPLATPENACAVNETEIASQQIIIRVYSDEDTLLASSNGLELAPFSISKGQKVWYEVISPIDYSITIYPPAIVPVNEDGVQILPKPIKLIGGETENPFEFEAKQTGEHLIRFEFNNGGCILILNSPINVKGDTPGPDLVPPTPTPTPTPFYPPPPPAPGVPGAQPCHAPCSKSPSPPAPNASSGLLQENLPELMPPTCDAAEYVGVYIPPDNSQRVLITEPDEIPAKTVGGTLVTRAWSIQNIGTCTWGPGYELAFYGGRSMGSGGVAFESFFPSEPARRNIIVNGEQLIAPQGFPNEIANIELALVAPVTPGIHQSYWRMRNPQGVYFGPIVGVTLEVVRDCSFGNYGAPVINKFEILGVGNVYQPDNPVDVDAILGQPVTLEWSISNAQSYDIVIKSPTGNTQNISTGNTTDRASFIPTELGEYTITLYADNSPCTAIAIVNVSVFPPADSDTFFVISVANLSSPEGAINITWQRGTADADEYRLVAQRYEQHKDAQDCSLVFEWPPRKCVPAWGEWKPSTSGSVLPEVLIGVQGQGLPAQVTGGPGEIQSASITVSGNGQTQTFSQGQQTSAQRTVGGPANSEATANLTNIIWGLCPADYDPKDPNNTVHYGIKYRMAALKNGELLESHPFSISDDATCGVIPATLNTEIIEDAASSGGQEFNPGQ